MEEYPPSPKKNRLATLAFWEVGVFATLFVVVTLALLFGLLNYFNILPISQLWPNQFAFLPHRPVPTKNNIGLTTNPTIFPTLVFNYDTKKAEALLTQYLKDNIKPEFLPAKIEVKNKLIDTGKQEGTDYEFGANWTINSNIFFQSNFHYQLDSNNSTDMEFSIQPQGVKETTANISLAKTLTITYLKNVPESPTFECGTFKTTTSFCENFSTIAAGKVGFGLVIDQSTPNTTLIFSCFIPKDSVYYQKRTSCLLFREKT